MKGTNVLFYIAGALALIAVLISAFDDGITRDEYPRTGFLVAMAIFMVYLGQRQGRKPL